MHGSLEDHFLVIRIPWLNKVITYLLTFEKFIFDSEAQFSEPAIIT